MKTSEAPNLRRRAGFGLAACGLLANEWLLAALFSADGELEPGSRALIRAANLVLVVSGLWIARRSGKGERTAGNRLLANTALLLAGFLLAFGSAEVLLRWAGKTPWITEPPPISIEPEGPFFTPHPTLGYAHRPGKYTITLGRDFSFHATHGEDSLRVTRRGDEPRSESIWIFGCSFTYGWSVDDEETYSWQLAERLPETGVVNFGVNGYGTVHSLLQFRRALAERPKPALVILAYASFHDHRNVFSRTRRKAVVPWNRLGPLSQPYARFDGEGKLAYGQADVTYRGFPFSRSSALVNFLEDLYNHYERRKLEDHRVSRVLIGEMSALAREEGIPFLLSGIDRSEVTAAMLDHFGREGAAVVDISLDLGLPENTNAPHDSHPSALAHERYAETLEKALRGLSRGGENGAGSLDGPSARVIN